MSDVEFIEKNHSLVIGITGPFGSGKTTAADFFESRGFRKIVLSSFLEEEAQKRGVKQITRRILQDIGNEWRDKDGNNILIKKALTKVEKEKLTHVIIDGIRNVAEIDELRKNENFILIGIITNRKVRFHRLQRVKRRELLTWELFNSLDRRDLGLGENESGLQVGLCLALSDIFVTNNNSAEKFKRKLERLLDQIQVK